MILKFKSYIFLLILITLIFGFNNLEAKRQNLRGKARTDFRSANVYLQQEVYDKALEFYLSVLENAPDHVESMKTAADLYFMLAEEADDAKAKEIFEIANSYFKKTIETILSISDWQKYDNFETIKNDAELKMRSIWVRVFKMGQDFFSESEFDHAERIFTDLLQLAPDSTQTYQMLAAIADKKGDVDKAVEYSLKILEVDPSNTQILINLAIEYEHKQDWENAKLYYNKFIVAEPNNTAGYLSMAYVNLQLENFEEALNNYESAITIEPNNVDIVANAASVAQRLDNDEKAVMYLKKLVEIEKSAENVSFLCYSLAKVQDWAELLKYSKIWHELSPQTKEAVQFIVISANQLNDTQTSKKYQEILGKLK